jgi:NitT/TauT family transport system ATP-binding protein
LNEASTPIVTLKDVSLRYGRGREGTLALENLDLEVMPGEFVAVVGLSGCGKSSLLKLISGLHPATSGDVRIHGRPIHGPLGNVGMAFQNASLLPWRSTLDNVLLPLEIVKDKRNDYRRNRRQHLEKAKRLLDTVGLKGFEQKLPQELSGGMRQRTSLCRALIHEPELLLLDEPFGALDAFTREELWGVLQHLRHATGCTVVLITHDLTEAVYLADTVYVMGPRPGRIVYAAKSPLAHPRDLDDRYRQDFIQVVADLRHHIGAEHGVAA